jgi:hypothetical protein
MGCGNRLPNGLVTTATEAGEDVLPEVSELDDVPDFNDAPVELETLPDTELPEVSEPAVDTTPPPTETTPAKPEDDLSWEVDEGLVADSPGDTPAPVPETVPESDSAESKKSSEDLSWDVDGIDPDIKEGMPFKEVEPPRVMAEEMEVHPVEVFDHLFPEGKDDATRDAVTHLFPGGRGVTSKDFIDVVVGTPKRIAVTTPMPELETPECPSCGFSISGDGFEYPGYVYEAMGKARMEDGFVKLEAKEFEPAIETFEMAKKLFERAAHEKGIADATKMVDDGYDAMANDHFEQAESHKKIHEFEWAIVQFRKARELYMFSTDAKKRTKCSEKVRECYVDWGKVLEAEGDALVKGGQTRKALTKYQEAAQRYREGEDNKKLKGLDKKIRKA